MTHILQKGGRRERAVGKMEGQDQGSAASRFGRKGNSSDRLSLISLLSVVCSKACQLLLDANKTKKV